MNKLHKLLALILAIICIMACFVGCSTEIPAEPNERDFIKDVSDELLGFEQVYAVSNAMSTGTDPHHRVYYLREKLTDVMYIWRLYGSGKVYGGFTVMMDPNTNGPMLYDNWLAYMKTHVPVCTQCDKAFSLSDSPQYCPDCGGLVKNGDVPSQEVFPDGPDNGTDVLGTTPGEINE